MADTNHPLVQELALAHAGRGVRSLLTAFFELDTRLAQFVSQAKEPILTQMRIAWWRDQLTKPVTDRPKGDPILDTLTELWSGEEAALIALVDGWEALLAEPPLAPDAALEFARGRGACFAAIARLIGKTDSADRADYAGQRWALADLFTRMSDDDERDFVIGQATEMEYPESKLPYAMRSVAILERLAENVLMFSADSMISNRRDLLLVIRLGLLGK
jgi:phytoene synthase